MNFFKRFIVAVYSRSLALYPPRFKSEFADEMHTVFRDSVADAVVEGSLSLMLLCGKEFAGIPFSILKEFWYEFQGEDLNMQELSLAPIKPGSWWDSFWAGLPHLLIAILFATTSALASTGLGTVSGIVFGLMLLAGFLATIYYTWRNHWPAWSASWYGYLGLIILLFSTLPYQYTVGIAKSIFEVIHFILWPLCLATLLYWLSRRNPIEGLLMAMPVIVLFWVTILEFIPNPIRFWLTFWLFLLPALTAAAITRLNDIKKAVWLVLGASMLSGLPIAYARTYWNNVPVEYSTPPSFGKMAGLFSVPWLASAALVLGPILGWGLWNLGRKYGKVGRISAALVIAGMIVNLLGHFSYWWWFSKDTYLNALQLFANYKPSEAASIFMVYAGLTATLVGALVLAFPTWKHNKLLSVALVFVPLALPLVARFATYFGYYVNIAGTSLELVRLSEASQYLVLFVGAAWLAICGWTTTRLYNPSLREGTA